MKKSRVASDKMAKREMVEEKRAWNARVCVCMCVCVCVYSTGRAYIMCL